MTDSQPIRELLERAQCGDQTAFETLVDEHADRLEYYVRLRLGEHLRCRVEVDDILQQVMVRACRSLQRFRWAGESSFLRWLKAIAENVILETARSDNRDRAVPLHDQPVEAPSQGRVLQRQERFDRLQDAFDSLSPDHRRVILFAHLQQLPLKTVAERMGRSPDAVKQLLWRALQQLRARFGQTESLHLPHLHLHDEGTERE